MARNVEIKASVGGLAAIREKAMSLATAPPQLLRQVDTFFDVPSGRLKVREFADGSGELIAYERPDQSGPKTSTYTRVSCGEPELLVRALGAVLPIRGRVVKRREVILAGRTRIHLDEVEGLGSFVELEVVLRDDEPSEVGQREARDVMTALGVDVSALVEGAYIDLHR